MNNRRNSTIEGRSLILGDRAFEASDHSTGVVMVTNLKKILKKPKEWIYDLSANHPVKLSFYVFLLFAIVVIVVSSTFYKKPEFRENILIEAHGMILDLLVIGVLVFWLQLLGEKRLNIRRYQDEIEDYLGWKEEEATHRIAGNIKRLNRERITKLKLTEAHLAGADLKGANLAGSDLIGANLRESNLLGANLVGADLRDANLYKADLWRANLEGAKLTGSHMKEANLAGANLKGANLEVASLVKTHLEGADLRDANLRDAYLTEAHLEGANLRGANLRYANLWGAHLEKAYLRGADLTKAECNKNTMWPEGFDLEKSGVFLVE